MKRDRLKKNSRMKISLAWALLTTVSLWQSIGVAQEQPYTILISFDGFRWDYIDRGYSPNLQHLAEDGARTLSLKPVFPSKTFPNHYTIVTGQYSEGHGLIANNYNDPFSGERYSLRDQQAVREAKWYLGEAFWETAERQGVRSASYFWPGSEMNLSYRRASYFHHYEHERPYEARVQGVLDWLQLPDAQRPRFITLYFDAVDGAGHWFGPDAPETNSAIARVDSMLGMLVDGLQRLGLREQTNVIVVSDHGMTDIDSTRTIWVDDLLGDLECDIEDRGPLMLLTPQNASVDEVYQVLKKSENRFRVYTRETMPENFHFARHPFIPPVVLLADIGWSLATHDRPVGGKGHHGFDPNHLDMHGIFYANGPSFKKGYRSGTIHNIDIYPLLCAIYGIEPRLNIDGRLERVEFLLAK